MGRDGPSCNLAVTQGVADLEALVDDAIEWGGLQGTNYLYSGKNQQHIWYFIRPTNEYIGNIYNILLITPLADKFNLCLPFGGDLPEDTASFMTSIVGIFKGAVQFNSLNPMNIKNVCETMENEEVGTPIDQLSELNAR